MKKDRKKIVFFEKIKTVFSDILKPYVSKEGRTFQTNEFKVVAPYPFGLYIMAILVYIFIVAWSVTGINVGLFFSNLSNMWRIIGGLIQPNFSFFPRMIDPLLETIQISIAGTVVGAVLAVPFAILSSSNIVKNKFVYVPIRFLMSLIRTIPVLVYAAILMFIVGMGFLAGSIALSIFTFTIVSKMLYESIETIDMLPYEAIESTGATRFQALRAAVVPQVIGSYISIVLYNFEINIRSASILGFVGAGGIGILLNDRIGWRKYEDVGMILLVIFAVVLSIESLSRYLRRRLN